MSGPQARRLALKELQDEIIAELLSAEAPLPAIHYVLTVLLGHEVSKAAVSQRIRREKERRCRVAFQNSKKPELRRRAVKAFNAVCAYCEREGRADADPDGNAWELDRIVAGRFGGEYGADNVALSCHACNQRKLGNFVFLELRPASLAEREAA